MSKKKRKGTFKTDNSIEDKHSKFVEILERMAKLSSFERKLTDDLFKKENFDTYDVDTKLTLFWLVTMQITQIHEFLFRLRDLGKEILGVPETPDNKNNSGVAVSPEVERKRYLDNHYKKMVRESKKG